MKFLACFLLKDIAIRSLAVHGSKPCATPSRTFGQVVKSSVVQLAFLWGASSLAQANPDPRDYPDPGQLGKDIIQQELRLRDKEKKQNVPAITEEALPEESAEDNGPSFLLKGIRFTKSVHLTQEELASIIRPKLGKPITYKGLQNILTEVNSLYRHKNIYTAVAVFPEQTVQDGTVVIRLVEGSIGEIAVEGNDYTEDAYFRQWLNHEEYQEAINVEALERDILFYNRLHDQRLQAELRAGKAFGLTDIVITASENSRNIGSLYLDNYGNESTDEMQVSGLYQRQQLFRPGDKALFYGLASKGLKSISTSYNTVLGTSGWKLGGSFQYTDSELIEGDFADQGVTGDSLRYGLEASYLVYSETNIWANLLATINSTYSKNNIRVDLISDYKTNQYQLGGEVNWLGDQWQLSGRLLYSSVDSKEKALGSHRKINLFSPRATFIYNFDSPFYALSVLEMQLTSEKAIPGAVSFSLGGPSTLRGYKPGIVSGDKGWYQQIELHYNGFTYNEYQFDLFGFYDHGQVESSLQEAKQSMASLGAGIRISGNEWLALDLTIANALKDVVPDQDSTRLYARVSCTCWD